MQNEKTEFIVHLCATPTQACVVCQRQT